LNQKDPDIPPALFFFFFFFKWKKIFFQVFLPIFLLQLPFIYTDTIFRRYLLGCISDIPLNHASIVEDMRSMQSMQRRKGKEKKIQLFFFSLEKPVIFIMLECM